MDGGKFTVICLILIGFVVSARSQESENPCGYKFPCDCSRECIQRYQWCDNITDCSDESDEKYCETSGYYGPSHKCNPKKHFTCRNEKCVPAVARCDGYTDCEDSSDEWNCETTSTPCPHVTPSPPPPTRKPLAPISSTPSQPECPECPSSAAPISEQKKYNGGYFPCDNGYQFIERGQWCDGFEHCNDGSDEEYCKTGGIIFEPSHKCKPRIHYTCRNKQCVPAVARCDGYNDCKDKSDEKKCPDTEPTPKPIPSRPVDPTPSPHRHPVTPSLVYNPEWPEVLRPSVSIYTVYRHPGNCPTSNTKQNRPPRLPPFHFERKPELYRNNAEMAVEWLNAQRGFKHGWGKDTPRALVALSLASNSFDSRLDENDLMRRRLRLDLGAELIKNLKWKNNGKMSDTRLAMYINALMATCQDPRDIYGQNLAEQLHSRTQHRKNSGAPLYPFVYITLCLVDISLDEKDLAFLASLIHADISDEVSKDRFILAASALACFRKTNNWYRYKTDIDHLLDAALYNLQNKLQLSDGSFGSVYSTALAAQALNAIDSNQWNVESLYDYLLDNQSTDGSFGDMLATYYALPALAGRSLVHLRNTECHEPVPVQEPPSPCDEVCSLTGQSGILKTVRYSLVMGYPQRSAVAISMTVPEEFSFFDIMRIAQCTDKRFRFLHTENPTKAEVYAIADIANDPERDRRWHLYVLDNTNKTLDTHEIYLGDIRELIPEDSQELLFWYFKDHQTSMREP